MIFTPLVNFNERSNLISEIRMACSIRCSDTKDSRAGGAQSAETIAEMGELSQLRKLSDVGTIERSLKLNESLVVKMQLSRSRLKDDKMMETIGSLPNLMLLRLYGNAYCLEGGAFPNLKEVDIYFSEQLREIRFEEGMTPQMGSIEIYGCRLESGIVGVRASPVTCLTDKAANRG
ncbi:hypothetical protein EJB05_45222, partial [Eragrostis curvula]